MSAAEHARIAALASDPRVHQAFRWLHLHEPQLRRWQLEFIAVPAPGFGEGDRARWFLERFIELGLEDPHIDSEGNVLAQLHPAPPEGGTESAGAAAAARAPAAAAGAPASPPAAAVVLLSAHLDTVFPAGTDCTPRQEDEHSGPIFGPGSCDNGAGLTGLLALAAALKHAAIVPLCTILFCANVGEEGEGDLRGVRHLFGAGPFRDRIGVALALEGSGSATVVHRALGSRRLRITISGPGGHSWADAGRPNPILALASGLLALSSLPLPSSPRTTLNCGTIRGGTSVNSIPESASADLDLRSTSSLELDRTELAVLSTLTAAVDGFGSGIGSAIANPLANPAGNPDPNLAACTSPPRPADVDLPRTAQRTKTPGLHLHVERIGDRPAAALPSTSTLAASLRAVDRHLGLVTEFRIGSTDANLPLSLGIPALAIGAGGTGGGIHTLAEWYDPTGRDLALRRILLLLLDSCAFCGGSSLGAGS